MAVRRILTGVTGALLTPLLLASACGGGGSSVANPPVSPTTASSSPTGAPQRETPEAFIRRWFDVGTDMQNSGETGKYRSMQKGCSDCLAVANRVEKTYSAGGYFKTRGVRGLHVLSTNGPPNKLTLDVRVDLAPTTFVERSGAAVKHFTGGPAHFQVGLQAVGDSWLVTNFAQVAT